MDDFARLKAQKEEIITSRCRDLRVEVLAVCTQIAMEKQQVTGPKSEYFVTLRQLELILRGVE
jgi:hypothetical protein